MGDRVLIFYGSYRSDRQGIRLAEWPRSRTRCAGYGSIVAWSCFAASMAARKLTFS